MESNIFPYCKKCATSDLSKRDWRFLCWDCMDKVNYLIKDKDYYTLSLYKQMRFIICLSAFLRMSTYTTWTK